MRYSIRMNRSSSGPMYERRRCEADARESYRNGHLIGACIIPWHVTGVIPSSQPNHSIIVVNPLFLYRAACFESR